MTGVQTCALPISIYFQYNAAQLRVDIVIDGNYEIEIKVFTILTMQLDEEISVNSNDINKAVKMMFDGSVKHQEREIINRIKKNRTGC